MKNIIKNIIFIFLILSSCKVKKEDKRKAVVRVFDKYLYLTEISEIVPDDISPSDSETLAREYIDKWIRKQLLIKKAEITLTDEEKQLEDKIENYRNSLLIYKYEQNIINQFLDTSVTEDDLLRYYETNINNFVLTDPIVKGILIQIPISAPDISKLKKWLNEDIIKNIANIEGYVHNYALKYEFFGDNWVSFKAIERFLPEKIYNSQQFLKKSKFYEFNDTLKITLLRIFEYKLDGNTAPFEFVKNDINNIILNKRKIELLNKHSEDIYKEAIKRGYFNIY